ncbi:MAG: CHAT domain-containing tetratricopeptide repeat protein [Chloroflexota bacterium]
MLRFKGQYAHAVEEYERTEHEFDVLGLAWERARTEIGHTTALRFLGRYSEAVQLALRSRGFFQKFGDDIQAAKQSNNLGTIYRPMGRPKDALAAYRDARRVFRNRGEAASLADVEQNIGNVLVDLGRFDEALGRLRVAARLRRQLGLRADAALTTMNMGVLLLKRGELGDALAELLNARAAYQELGAARGMVAVDLELLSAYVALNLTEESERTAERAIGQLRSLPMPLELGQALLMDSRLAFRTGDLERAQAHVHEAARLFQVNGMELWAAAARLHSTLVRIQPDDRDGLQDLLDGTRRATAELSAAGWTEQAVAGWVVESAVLDGMGRTSEALVRLRQAQATSASLGAPPVQYQVDVALAALLERLGDQAGSLSTYVSAIGHLEAIRAGARTEDLKLAVAADKVNTYERAVALQLQDESTESVRRAFGFVERSKSPTLLERMVAATSRARGRSRHRAARAAGAVAALRARLNHAYDAGYAASAVPTGEDLWMSSQSAHIAGLERELRAAERELQLLAPNGSGDARTVDVSGLLAPDALLLEYYSHDDELVAFLIQRGQVSLRRVGSLSEVETLVEAVGFQIQRAVLEQQALLAAPEMSRARMEHFLGLLWDALIAPVADMIPWGGHVVVVPHGPLCGLPFHAFHRGDAYFTDLVTVSYSPSAGVFAEASARGGEVGERLLLLGIEDAGLECIEEELRAVSGIWSSARSLFGRRATRRALRRAVGSFDVLHIASHAVFRADNPAYSSIKLADGWLTASELGGLLDGVGLVTLSACETALTTPGVGDEIQGLTRAILASGCAAVVASLWPVNDVATAPLMTSFYAALRRGLPAARALREAMSVLRQTYDHPYFWAPFTVTGGSPGAVGEPNSSGLQP